MNGGARQGRTGSGSTRICLAWLIAVPVWAIWEAVGYRGLYRWLCEWQLTQHGQYEAALTSIIPAIALMGPALAVLARRERAHPTMVVAPLGSVAAAATVSRFLLVIACLGAATCAGAWLLSLRLPEQWSAPVAIDLAAFGERVPPAGAVILIGDADTGHSVAKSWKTAQTLYTPLAAPGAKGQPVRFVAANYVGSGYLHGLDVVFPYHRFVGVLIENGLPIDMERALARSNVQLTTPYYLLTRNRGGPRASYRVTAWIGFGVAAFASVALAAVRISGGRAARKRRV